MLELFFGAKAQIIVGVFFVLITVGQGWWWGVAHAPPGATAIFWLSIEAMLFGAYGVVATGLGYRKTEHVETAVVENIEQAEEVEVKQ